MNFVREIRAKAIGLVFALVLPTVRGFLTEIKTFPLISWQFMLLIFVGIVLVWVVIAFSQPEDNRFDWQINAVLIFWGLLVMFFSTFYN
jgi:uncharacterized protein YacL